MSLIVGLAGAVIKAVSAARTASHATGHEAPALEELHGGLGPLRGELAREKVQEAAASAATGQDADATDADGGFFSDAIDWLGDLLSGG